jgi:hypothetical protein
LKFGWEKFWFWVYLVGIWIGWKIRRRGKMDLDFEGFVN